MMLTLKRAFFWLSGAGTESLEACPHWEQRKYVAFGATVLVPSTFAFIASAYALSTLTDRWEIILPIACVWAFIILTIDRALLASYRPYLSWGRKLGQFSLRLVVAVLMGLTIAHPVTLLLFRDTITSEIEKERETEIVAARAASEEDELLVQTKIDRLNEEITAKRAEWDQSFQASFLEQRDAMGSAPDLNLSDAEKAAKEISDQRIEEAVTPLRAKLTFVEQEMESMQAPYSKLQGELDYWQKEFEREVNGQRSGIVGVGPRAKSVQADQLEWRREEIRRMSSVLESLTAEQARLREEIALTEAGLMAEFANLSAEAKERAKQEQARLDALRQQVEQAQADQFVEQQNQLRANLSRDIETKLLEGERLQSELAQVAEDERTRVQAIQAEPRQDILTQTLALHGLFGRGEEGGRFAFTAYAVLTLLFMLVDTIPLVVKFFCRPGPYDTLLDQDEVRFDKRRQAFLRSYGQFMDREVDRETLFFNLNRPLENALAEGIDRSRAGKQFLESLMEMERAFEQRMQHERDLAAQSGKGLTPERLAVLEEMAETFYRDLRERMEQFFRSGQQVLQG